MSSKPRSTTAKSARRARHPSSENDPALIAIAECTAAEDKALDLYRRIDELKSEARKKHGDRPIEMIGWRNYTIGGSEIEDARDRFIRDGFDKHLIGKEYKDAKKRYAAKIEAGVQWDRRAGLTKLRREYEKAHADEHRALARLLRVKPKTTRGALAMLNWVITDMDGGLNSSRAEHDVVLRSVAQTLPKLFVATA